MARLGLADQTDLARWANSLAARGDFPRLIRRLILETGRGVVRLGFPAGEGIGAEGWDGTVRATEATAFIPEGLSLWEVSTRRDVKRKADGDYAKRLGTPDGSPARAATYVAALLRRWQDRSTWATEKEADERWQAVRAYGLDDIETWLESAPVTHAWLSELVGLHPHGLVAAEAWWARWSGATSPAFPAAAVLAGRDEAIGALEAQLARPGQIITVQGASRDDVLSSISALGIRNARVDGGQLFARTAFIDEVAAWRRWREHSTPLLLAPATEDVAAELDPASPHHLIVPLDTGPAMITLPPIDAQRAKDALVAAGLDEPRAAETAALARLSLQAARRSIASHPELHRPSWARPPLSRLVRRALLAGRWHEGSAADLATVCSLLGVAAYDTLLEDLASLMSPGDPLLARFGASVGLVSHLDAWRLTQGDLRKDDLEAFHTAACTVFGDLDPALDLPADERWQAQLRGKTPAYSGDLRRGLATTLALLGASSSAPIRGSTRTAGDWAADAVWRILEAANQDATCRIWASLHDVLPLLAEAAPPVFLEAVRNGLSGDPPLLHGIFSDGEQPASPHTGLLWALETCAWSPTDFGQAVDLLARLAEIDPGGKLANRPRATLAAIFRPWYPQNSVNVERRLEVLDALRQRHELVAWPLMLAIARGGGTFADLTSAPHSRSWKPHQISVTRREYSHFVEEVCKRLLEHLGTEPERWTSLLGELPNLPPQTRTAAQTQLLALAGDDGLATDIRKQIWEALRSTVARHREFADADWALPPEEVSQLEETARRLEPSAPLDRFAWLFDQTMPEIPNVHHSDGLEAYDAAIEELRLEAARAIAEGADWPQLRAFAANLKQPSLFGWALARTGLTRHDTTILELLGSEDPLRFDFAPTYLSERFRAQGWPWIEIHLGGGRLSPEQSGQLLLATHDFPAAWEVAETLGAEVEGVFWRHFPLFGLGSNFADHLDVAVQRLLSAGRPGHALHLLIRYLRNLAGPSWAGQMAAGLEELLGREATDPEARAVSHYEIVQLFDYLESSTLPRDRLAKLEWSYLPALGHEANPPTLGSYLASDPSFFVEIVSTVYRPRPQEATGTSEAPPEESVPAKPTEQEQARAQNAYRLLSEWRVLPGRREDGTVDREALGGWVTESRRELKRRQRLTVGDVHIGMVLASCPADPDGAWPCEEVRDLLEALQSREVEDGLRMTIHNRRGATSRAMLDGGDQERTLAATYREQAQRFLDRWPRTAAIFRALAESYEHQARILDEGAEKRRTGFDL
jgi:hypothetical protein